eukprot:jgi/Galph1/3480/GphlegSOOS_G2129.1
MCYHTFGALGQFLQNGLSKVSSKLESTNLPFGREVENLNPFKLVAEELSRIAKAFQETIAVNHPVLEQAAITGKRFRPTVVVLMAYAINATNIAAKQNCNTHVKQSVHFDKENLKNNPGILSSQLKLAEITELIHVASLLHDDVIDVADTRRGVQSVNTLFGNQLSVLAGDFLLSRASVSLARLRNCDVVEILSTVIEHLVHGEILQLRVDGKGSKESFSLDVYLQKTFLKTASLIANSCQAVALLANVPKDMAQSAFEYGRHVGLAYQLVDDALDFATTNDLGKPSLSDIRQGNVTAPILFAMEQFPEVVEYAKRKFQYPQDISNTLQAIQQSKAIERTLELAAQHCQLAQETVLTALEDSPYRQALVEMATFVLERKR